MNRVSAPTRAPLSRVGAGAAFLACLAGGSPAALADNCEAHHLGSLPGQALFARARGRRLESGQLFER